MKVMKDVLKKAEGVIVNDWGPLEDEASTQATKWIQDLNMFYEKHQILRDELMITAHITLEDGEYGS
jgi:hypothetical protein